MIRQDRKVIGFDEAILRLVKSIGVHPTVYAALKADGRVKEVSPQGGSLLSLFFGPVGGITVFQDELFPLDRVALLNEKKVLLGWLQLGGDHGKGKGVGESETRTSEDGKG